jgi:sarcosine oxidase / L-pipecolate oxidase
MSAPSSILIIGAGEFGIATARALIRDPKYADCKITILDTSPQLPNPSGSSVDSSRIIRADYASLPYAKLGLEAQRLWRDTSDAGWGGQGRYHEPGIVLTANTGAGWYVQNSLENVRKLAKSGLDGLDIKSIQELPDKDAIRKATGHSGVSGDTGYANWGAGWADAEAVMRYVIECLLRESKGRVQLRSGSKTRRLLYEPTHNGSSGRSRCTGALLEDGSRVIADLVILAAGAWTPTLIDLKGRAIATGQTLAYLELNDEEERRLASRPTIFNMSIGMFIIPPRGRELKVARHGYGYRNLKNVSFAEDGPQEEVSVPELGLCIPVEAEQLCRNALVEMIPELSDRGFSRTRICWYCDT